MTAALAHCVVCGAPFAKKRQAHVCCSKACKQAKYREKCNAGCDDPSDTPNAPVHPPVAEETAVYVRCWGPNRLSDIEMRVLGILPTGMSDGAAMLYRSAT